MGAPVEDRARAQVLQVTQVVVLAHDSLVDLVYERGVPVQGFASQTLEGGPGSFSSAEGHGIGRSSRLHGPRAIGHVGGRGVGECRRILKDVEFVRHYDDLSTWPPKPARMAESTLAVNSPSPRDSKRCQSDAAITGAGTDSLMAASTVQRPSPESET